MRFLVINGPNLNLLGTREPDIYGTDTLADLEGRWRRHGSVIGVGISTFQSNHEGAIIDTIQAEASRCDGIVINPGALSHYSYAIHDAIVAVGVPTVEVHISDIREREEWRRVSVTASAAMRTISGRGAGGYLDAINLLRASLVSPPTTVAYGDDDDQIMDVRHPTDAAMGVIGLLHGGFWRTKWERDIMDPLAVALSERGWTTANIEYRRGPGSFGTSTSDVAAAVEFLRSHAESLGIEPRRPVLLGHSAGGYLAIREVLRNAGTSGAIALGSVIDLRAIADAATDDDPVTAYLGGSAADDPARWTEAALTGEPTDPIHLIHGTEDVTTPIDHARSFAADHDAVTLVPVPGASHMDVIDPYHETFAVILDVLDVLDGQPG
jgi:3-dehydroquinate dehydratase-2